MRTQDCLYTIAYLPRQRIEGLLLDEFAPLAREIRDHAGLDSLFFVRYSEPRWQLRFRFLGRPDWVRGELHQRLDSRLAQLASEGIVEQFTFARYERELERYGGAEGMELAERLFFHDSMAAMAFCEAERRGITRRSRREFNLLLTDRLVELAGLDRRQRLAFYRQGYAWALDDETWAKTDLEILERRFRELLPGLDRLLAPQPDETGHWGGQIEAEIAGRFLEDARPVLQKILEGLAAGRIQQDKVYLLWSYAHMFTNRLGLESATESVLRFFMHRYVQERRHVAA